MKKLQKYIPFGALGVSLMLHLAVFLGISGVIIIQAVSPKVIPSGENIPVNNVDVPLPPELPPEEAPVNPDNNNKPDEPTAPTTSQMMQNLDTISSNAMAVAPAFTVLAPGASMTGAPTSSAPGEKAEGQAKTGPKSPAFNPFGNSDISQGAGLEGYFYDLKVDKDGKETGMTIAQWQTIMKKFITSSNWNTADLAAYFKSPAPLFIKKFFITTRGSVEAPKAFKVPNKPALWAVLYQGAVTAPEDGTYTFAGFGDDLLAIRVNGKLIFDGGWLQLGGLPLKTYPDLWSKFYKDKGLIRTGKSFTAKAGEPVKLQILIGDQGGACAFFLMIRKEGVNYEKLSDGTPKLPLFQLDDSPVTPAGDCPPFSTEGSVWSVVK